MSEPHFARHEGGCVFCGHRLAECTCASEAFEEYERPHLWPHPIHGTAKPCDPENPCALCQEREANLRKWAGQ